MASKYSVGKDELMYSMAASPWLTDALKDGTGEARGDAEAGKGTRSFDV